MAMRLANPDAKYDSKSDNDRDSFVKVMDDFSKLEGYVHNIEERDDPATRQDLGKKLHDDPNLYSGAVQWHTVINGAREHYSDATKKLSGHTERDPEGKLVRKLGFVGNNFDEMLSALTDDEMIAYVQNINLYTTEDEKSNEVVSAVKEMQNIAKAAKDNNLQEYVNNKVAKMSDAAKAEYAWASNDPAFVQNLFNSFARKAHSKLEKALHTPDGKFDRKKIETAIKNSLEVARKEYDNEEDDETKDDIFNAAERPYYMTLARTIHSRLKKEKKLDEDEDKVKRAGDRRKLGLPL